MIDVRIDSIIYQSQIYYRDLVNNLTVEKKLGKALDPKWDKADTILGYLEALNYRSRLTDQADIDNVNYILECLIKLCELNQYPVSAPITFQSPPAVIVGAKGDKGDTGNTGARGFTGLATDFSVISASATTTVDLFPITDSKGVRWDYFVINNSGAQRVSSILGQWTADGLNHELTDSGTEDLIGDTSGIEFDINISAGVVHLTAVITSGTWSITGSRYFVPNNGNGSGPITNSLPLGQVYIGNASNQAQAQSVSGVINITNLGVTSYTTGSILDTHINSAANITLSKLASLSNNIVPITNGSGKLISSTLSPTTLAYVDIGSSLTGLLSLKLTDPMSTIGDILIRNSSNITTRLGIGAVNQVLTVIGGTPAWQNLPGGITGLTTGYLPKASSSTTLVNSIVSESTGAITVAGTIEVQGGIRTQASGPYFKIENLLIGNWNMDTTASVTVAHGLSTNYKKMRILGIIIRDDSDTGYYPLNYISGGGVVSGSWFTNNSTNIILQRSTVGQFDNPSFSVTGGYNRGWVTIMYEV